MRQEQFIEQNEALWDQFRELATDLSKSRFKQTSKPADQEQIPKIYRRLCSHYALAQSRSYSPGLVGELHDLVLLGHKLLYRRQESWLWRVLAFIGVGFPRALRRNVKYFWVSLFLFVAPMALLGGYCYSKPDLIYSVLADDRVASVEYMYDPVNHKPGRTKERSSESDVYMFGFYISNNISVGFRTFAGGILFGIGTVFFLLFNGVFIGSIAGHLTRLGSGEPFWSFVSGHGSFELTAIVICGGAGLMLARATIAPGQSTRIMALKKISKEAVLLVCGATLMLVVAAFIEAFWSSMQLDAGTKYFAAAVLWIFVIAYLGLSGKSDHGS